MNKTLTLALFSLLLLPTALAAQNDSGLHDLVIFKPGVHDRDLPKVIFEKIYGDKDDVQGQRVTIPQSVHVHRYFYSGNKEFQGPIVAGGPTMVVARHPKSGEQMYVDVVLPSGAPKIAYTKKSITYVYGRKRVTINFKSFFNQCVATVDVKSGRGAARVVNETVSKGWNRFTKSVNESPVTEFVVGTSTDVKNVFTNLGRGAGDVLKQGADSAKAIVEVIPGVKPLLDSSDREAERQYSDKIQAADSRAKRLLPKFIRTNR